MPAPTGPRPISRALAIVLNTEIRQSSNSTPYYMLMPRQRGELIRLLEQIDASTGKPDSARKSRSVRSTKRATKGGR